MSGYWGMIANKAQFSDEQKAKLAKLLVERKGAAAELKKQFAQLRSQRSASLEQNDTEKLKQFKAQYGELKGKQKKLEADFFADVRAILDKGQVLLFEQARLTYTMLRKCKRFKLTAEQQGKVEQLCTEAAEKLSKIDTSDAKAVDKIVEQLKKQIMENLLTKQQQEMLKKLQPKKG